MKRYTKPLALLLVLCMGAALLLACANETPQTDDPNTTPTATAAPSATDAPTATPTEEPDTTVDISELIKTFPQKNFGGEEFVIVASSTFENTFTIQQFPTEDQMTGDIVHDALYARDNLINEYFTLSIYYNDMLDSAVVNRLMNSVLACDDECSLILSTLSSTALPFFNNGLLYDLAEMDEIDLTRSWWNKNSIDNFMINDRIFMATGAITNRYVYAPYAMLFNVRLLNNEGLQSPYEMVNNGTWTLENFIAMIDSRYKDLNGNDTVDLKDYFGLAPAADSETAYFFGAGCHLVVKDGDELTLTLAEEKNFDVLETVGNMFAFDDVLHYQSVYDSNGAFNDGRAIFHSTALCDITMLSNMEDAYGIVPMPKLDEEQESYYSNPNRYISTMALMPDSIAKPHDAALVIEAMAAVSQYTSLDKQYESVLLNRQTFDAESKLNLIAVVESINYDWLYVMNLGGIETVIQNGLKAGKVEFASAFEQKSDSAQQALENLIEKFD